MRENPTVNYSKVIKDTLTNHYNVRDEFKHNTIEENQFICHNDRRRFSVGCINLTGELNVGMMIRSASLFGAENFYIFGRRKFDKRSTVGAENYINIFQRVLDNPIQDDEYIYQEVINLCADKHDIVLCEQGGKELGSFDWNDAFSHTQNHTPLFLFGSESHGLSDCLISDYGYSCLKVSIPQRGVLRSFNVSAAMNIICWDYISRANI